MSADPPLRSAGIDLLRLAAVAAVVVAHAIPVRDVAVLAYAWHVPVFFVLAGYLWTPGRGVLDELLRRVRTLAVPYAFWLLALLALLGAEGRGLPASTVSDALLGGSRAGRPFSAFWFVTALLTAVVLWRCLERLPRRGAASLALAGAAVGTVAGGQLAEIPLAAGTAATVLVLLLFGEWLREVGPRVPSGLAGALVLAGLTSAFVGLSRPVNLKAGDLGTPVLSLVVACAISGGLVLLAQRWRVPGPGRLVAAATAPALLVVVLTHAAVLHVVYDSPAVDVDVPGGPVAVALAALLLPLAGGMVLARTPLAPLTNGRQRARQGSNLRPSA